MWKPTIRGLLARKVRLVLTAMAVLLGVSFISATYVLTDTVKDAFDSVFAQTLTGVDLRVQGARPLGQGDPQRVPESALADVRAVPGVARAEGFVDGYAQFVGDDGESIGGGGPPTFGASWVNGGPFELVDDGVSRAPRRSGEVAMDAGTAKEHGFEVGDRVRVLLDGPAREFEIVGLFGFGDRFDFGAVTFAAFDLDTAQEAFDARGSLDGIYVQREPGVSVAQLQHRLTRELGPSYEVLTASEATEQVGETVRGFLGFFTLALLGFAAIGVVVGAFVIFNTFTILVAQRTRELGLLRAMGATGGQVIGSVVLEALLVGVVASAIGLVVGILLGIGLLELLRGLGLQLPETSTVLLGRTIVVSLVVGIVVTVVASLLPALRAARVPPIAAINEVGTRAVGSMTRRLVVGTAIFAVGVAMVVIGLVRSESVTGIFEQVQVVAVGAFLLLVGVVVLLAAVARPVAGAIGRPLRALGVSGVLARANAMRNPRRTAVTASAIVIGLALVGLTATFGASAKASVRRDTAAGLRADFVVKADGFAGFSPEVADRLTALPAV
ncbi:MAG: ABC transporter permease, partial [Acidimicrobiia bacterium]